MSKIWRNDESPHMDSLTYILHIQRQPHFSGVFVRTGGLDWSLVFGSVKPQVP